MRRTTPTGPPRRGFALPLALGFALAGGGCSTEMRGEKLDPGWTHESAVAKAEEAIAIAIARGRNIEPLRPGVDLKLDDQDLLARATVRRDSMGWPAPGPAFAVPFIECARGRPRTGVVGIVSGAFAAGLVADLLVFFPFGYSHHAVFVEVPSDGAPECGNGFYESRANQRVAYFDFDDRWLWRRNRMDEIAEAFEFLVREARREKGLDPEPAER